MPKKKGTAAAAAAASAASTASTAPAASTASASAASTASTASTSSTPIISSPATTTSSSYVKTKIKGKSIKNVDLCDFTVAELIHDFTKGFPFDSNGKETNGISSNRYKIDNEVFDRIIADGLNGCGNVDTVPPDTFVNYDEDQLLAQVAGANFKANIINGTLHNKNITVSTGLEYNVKTISKNQFAPEISTGLFDYSQCGIKIFEKLFDSHQNPVLLVDTPGGIVSNLQLGANGTPRKVYIFSPTVVRADSAGKINLTIKKSLIENFGVNTGIKLINVMDDSPFTAIINPNKDKVTGFFSKYSISTTVNTSNQKIDQSWSGFSTIGTAGVVTRTDVSENNNRPNIILKLDPIINTGTSTISGPSNMLLTDSVASINLASKKREIFNNEIQAKRSGDWLPVIYLLNYDTTPKNLQTYSDPIDPTTIGPLPTSYNADFNNNNNMYIVTVDRPLVAYALYSGVNVIYCMASTSGTFYTALKKMP